MTTAQKSHGYRSQEFTSTLIGYQVWKGRQSYSCLVASGAHQTFALLTQCYDTAVLLSRISVYVRHCPRCWWMPVLFTRLQLAMLVLIIWGPLQRWDGCVQFPDGKHELIMGLHRSVCLTQSPQRELRTVLRTVYELQRVLVQEIGLIFKPACLAHTVPWRTSEVNDRLTN